MLPDLSDTATANFKTLSDSFKDREGVEVVPTFVPAAQINSEIEFELEHNLTNSHDGREIRSAEAACSTYPASSSPCRTLCYTRPPVL